MDDKSSFFTQYKFIEASTGFNIILDIIIVTKYSFGRLNSGYNKLSKANARN